MKRHERGFTALELMFVIAIVALVTLALASGVTSAQAGSRELDRAARLDARAEMYLERALAIPMGSPADGAASAGELSEFFDDDELFGTMTLHKLAAFGAAEFTAPGSGVAGRWRVLVSNDLNGDGDTDDAAEGRNDLLRVAIFLDDRLLTETNRFDANALP